MHQGLAGIRVVDFSTQIAGPYCSKLFVDAGAEVIKIEAPEGDSLRGWSATGADLGGRDSALFAYLNAGKQSVVGTAADPHVAALIAEADLVIEAHGLASDTGERLDGARLRAGHPALVVLSITPYGITGPWAARLATLVSVSWTVLLVMSAATVGAGVLACAVPALRAANMRVVEVIRDEG